jgi:hypothetical protein
MIGDMLADKAFTATIPRRITVRMNAIREMSNLGPHGEEVDAADAMRVMRDLVDVVEWLLLHCLTIESQKHLLQDDPGFSQRTCRVRRQVREGRMEDHAEFRNSGLQRGDTIVM